MNDISHHQEDLTNKCSTCGFCYEYCPVFAATGGDNTGCRDGAYHKQAFFQSDYLLSSCIQCKACYPSCYNGLTTTEMVRRGREAVVADKGAGRFRKMMFNHILPHHKRVASFMKGFSALRKSGGISLVKRLNMEREKAGIADALLDFDVEKAIQETPMPAARNDAVLQTVAYFRSCGFSSVLPCVGMTTKALILAMGHPVIELENACCGLPPYVQGDTKAAVRLAKKNIDLLEQQETILTECGSCSSFLKGYAGLLSDDEAYAEKARLISERVMDMNDFILQRLPVIADSMKSDKAVRTVTYHDACHLSRYQGIIDQPRDLIKAVPGLEFVELPESDRCCGGAGGYSITNHDISMKILDRKMENVRKTGASILATACPACMVQLSYGVKRAGLNVMVMHVNQVLAGSMDRTDDPGFAGNQHISGDE